jgi:uncharacterized membrane protein
MWSICYRHDYISRTPKTKQSQQGLTLTQLEILRKVAVISDIKPLTKYYNISMSKERVETFSDGVFAIILTLLVLELRVPEIANHASFSQYITALMPLLPKFFSFVLTFAAISNYWVGHHNYFRSVRGVNLGIVWLNILFLFGLCFLPFPTALLGSHLTDQFPIVLYGINSLFIALTFLALRMYTTHSKLFTKMDKVSMKSQGPSHTLPAIAFFAVGIPFAFVNVYVSLLCYILHPLLYFVPNLIESKIYHSTNK